MASPSTADPVADFINAANAAGTPISFTVDKSGQRALGVKGKLSPELAARLNDPKFYDAVLNKVAPPDPASYLPTSFPKLNPALVVGDLAMAVPQALFPEMPEARGAFAALEKAGVSGAEDFFLKHPWLSRGLYRGGRLGAGAGLGAAGSALQGQNPALGAAGGALGEGMATGASILGATPRYLNRAEALPRETAGQTGNVIADYLKDFLPNTSKEISNNAATFQGGKPAKNWMQTITSVNAQNEANTVYSRSLASIRRDVADSVDAYYKQKLDLYAKSPTPPDPIEIQKIQLKNQMDKAKALREFDAALIGKQDSGASAFTNKGEAVGGGARNQLQSAYRGGNKDLHDFLAQVDNQFGSNTTTTYDKLNEKYASFRNLTDMARNDKFRNPKTGGIERADLQKALQTGSTRNYRLSKSMGQDFERLKQAAGINPATSQSAVEGNLGIRGYASGLRPRAIISRMQTPFDPVHNMPGVLNPTKTGGQLGNIIKYLLRAFAGPEIINKANQ